jgi:hypothetical protein
MSESKIELVKSKTFTINLPPVGAPVAIRAEGDEVVVLVSLTLRPRDNVMDIDLDISTGGDRAAMAGLNQDHSAEIGRNDGSVTIGSGYRRIDWPRTQIASPPFM